MTTTFDDISHLGLSDEEAALLLYYVNDLSHTVDEAIGIVRNHLSDTPQTDEVVRAGRKHEEWLRANYHGDGTPIAGSGDSED